MKSGASVVTVSATDGFSATFTVTEIQNNSGQILVAYLKDGQPMPGEADGGEGPVRLVVGSDVYATRWVQYVVSIDVA
jgi:hypothetical protein